MGQPALRELDLLQEGQARLTKQIAHAGAALAATEVRWETIDATSRLPSVSLRTSVLRTDGRPNRRNDISIKPSSMRFTSMSKASPTPAWPTRSPNSSPTTCSPGSSAT
jgi:hypothetical protein